MQWMWEFYESGCLRHLPGGSNSSFFGTYGYHNFFAHHQAILLQFLHKHLISMSLQMSIPFQKTKKNLFRNTCRFYFIFDCYFNFRKFI